MDRFVSHYTVRIDAKGRLSIPAAFRAILARDGHEGLYCYPAIDEPAIEAGGHALRRDIEAWIAEHPPFSAEQETLSFYLETQSSILTLDGEGRVMLTEALKAHAGLSDTVVVAGRGQKFQFWEPERYRAHLQEATAKMRQLKRDRASRMAPRMAPTATGARE
jgi:MraZ protein